MSLPTPPRYIVVPQEIIEQAFELDKPRRALLGSFNRLLSLAWETKYQKTPVLNEEEVMEFLKLSRRQYFDQKADMELLHWLRSTHPRPGFVQFDFSRAISEKLVVQDFGAEKCTVSAENAEKRTDELKRIEEEESSEFKKLNSSSSSSLTQTPVRKSALVTDAKKMQLLIENLRLVFDEQKHGVLEMREEFQFGIPERALGWIAKAYHDTKLTAPIGLIVKHIIARDAPNSYYIDRFAEILPEEYLEAVEEITYGCFGCTETFPTREALRSHQDEKHPYPCTQCDAWFMTEAEEQEHFKKVHEYPKCSLEVDPSALQPINGGMSAERAWESVLGQLQMEMPRASFETWVRDTKAVRYDGNTLCIGVRNAYARDWLESRLASTVSRLLVGILRGSVDVAFVTE